MRRRALQRAEARWEQQTSNQLPPTYPDGAEYVLRSPLAPTVMPSQLRFMAVANDRGMRPVPRSLETRFAASLRDSYAEDEPAVDKALAMGMAGAVDTGDWLVAALVGGAGEYRFTHYGQRHPDHSWSGVTEWEARLELRAKTPEGFARVLADIGDWCRVPDPYAGHRSVLVACPERDIMDGTWWQYAIGSRGAPMPSLEIGETRFAEEIFGATGAQETRAPTLREFQGAKKHFFAIAGGPAGFVSFADADGVGWGSGYLDQLEPAVLTRRREMLATADWPDVDLVFDRLDSLVPRMRDFYDRAYRQSFWIAQFGYIDELEHLATEYVIEAG